MWIKLCVDFSVKTGIRCSGHYRVATWDENALEECQAQCKKDEMCASFSLELTNGKGCFLFDSEAQCTSTIGWTTGFKGYLYFREFFILKTNVYRSL